MPVINQNNPTLKDVMEAMDPSYGFADVVEQLNLIRGAIEDATMLMGNLPTAHQYTTRTGLPGISYRRYNEGVAPGKSQRATYQESAGMIAGYSVIDRSLARVGGDPAMFRSSEDNGFTQSFLNEVETGIFYNSTVTAPERFHGLTPRLNTLSASAPYQRQIFPSSQGSASGNDQMSIWLITWHPETCFLFYPKDSRAGLRREDLGAQLRVDSQGRQFTAWVTEYEWQLGLCVRDYRYLVRVCNIDAGNGPASTGSTIIQDMVNAINRHQNVEFGRTAFYINRAIRTALELQAIDTVKNATLSFDTIGGKRILTFRGLPVRLSEALLSTETLVS